IEDDAWGRRAVRVLEEKKIPYLLQTPGFPAGSVRISLDAEGTAQYRFAEPAAWDFLQITDRMRELAARALVVSFGSLAQRHRCSRDTIREFLHFVPQSAWKIFDVNLRQNYYSKALIEESLGLADWLKINEEELAVLQPWFGISGTEAEPLRRLEELFSLQGIIYTRGSEGSIVLEGDRLSCRPASRVKVVDTVGAGDAFTAAFIAARLHGMPLEKAHELSAEVAAYVCSCAGAMPEIPGELKHRMVSG
ncbi:MAG: PfkB family carbohydrate kinase, partial [Rikenellaceae bacterium]|nr:PfkB family carbohydrate kinase [Rikenellaceae bacterium]